jgi:hypothetical protein
MKTRRYRTGALLGSLNFSLVASGLQAQDERLAPPPPQEEHHAPPPNVPEGARDEKIRERIRDLHVAGNTEEFACCRHLPSLTKGRFQGLIGCHNRVFD